MFFKRLIFLITTLFSLTYCGLEIGEESKNPFVYKITEVSFCDILDYKDELRKYMNSIDYSVSSYRVENVLNCLAFKIGQYEKTIIGSHENHFTTSEILKLLNEPFISTESTAPVIDMVTDSKNYPQFLSAKNTLINIMRKHQNKSYVEFEDQCPKTNEQALSREDVVIFTSFLNDFSKFLVSIDVSSEVFFRLLHTIQEAPSISLKDTNSLSLFETIFKNKLWDTPSGFFQRVGEEQLNAMIIPLVSMAIFDYEKYHGEGVLTRGHIKYMLLNVYLVEMLFNLYDKNANAILEEKELDNAFCLFGSIISLSKSISLKNKNYLSKFVFKLLFSDEFIFDYALTHQEIPKDINERFIRMKFSDTGVFSEATSEEGLFVDYAGLTKLFRNLFKGFIK